MSGVSTLSKRGSSRLFAVMLALAAVVSVAMVIDGMPDVGMAGNIKTENSTDIVERDKTALKAELDRRFQQAVSMLHLKQYEYAIVALQEVLKIAPRMAEAHANLGYAYIGLGHYLEARNEFLISIDINQELITAYYGLAISEKELGNTIKAIGAMQSYVHLNKNETDPFLVKAKSALWEWRESMRSSETTIDNIASE